MLGVIYMECCRFFILPVPLPLSFDTTENRLNLLVYIWMDECCLGGYWWKNAYRLLFTRLFRTSNLSRVYPLSSNISLAVTCKGGTSEGTLFLTFTGWSVPDRSWFLRRHARLFRTSNFSRVYPLSTNISLAVGMQGGYIRRYVIPYIHRMICTG